MKHSLLLLFAVIFISGCTVPWPDFTPSADNVMAVKSFRAIPDKVSSFQDIKLILDLQNTGQQLPFKDSGFSPTQKDVRITLFDYCQGLFETPSVQCPDGAAPTA